eukprot:3879294-Prymnesium_polylepis.1
MSYGKSSSDIFRGGCDIFASRFGCGGGDTFSVEIRFPHGASPTMVGCSVWQALHVPVDRERCAER